MGARPHRSGGGNGMAEDSQELIGASLRRKEDPRLLRGEGRFVDDLPALDALHLGVLRSPHAHARLPRVDLGGALACPGVVAAVAGAEVLAALGPLPSPFWKRPEAELHAALNPFVRMETHHLV